MDKRQFYFEYYKLEDDRRTKIRHNLSFLLAIFSVLIGVMIFYLQNLTCIDFNWIGIIFYIVIAIIFLLFVLNVYYFIRAYHNYGYGYLPKPVTIESDIKKVKEYYQDSYFGDLEKEQKQELINNDIENNVNTYLIECLEINIKNNDSKSRYLHKATTTIIITIIFILLSSIPFFIQYYQSENIEKIEIINASDF